MFHSCCFSMFMFSELRKSQQKKSLKSTETKKYEVDFGIGNVFWVFHLYARLRLWVEVEKFKQLSDICQRSQYQVVFRIHAERFSSIDKKSQHAHVKNWQTFFRTIMLLNSVNYFTMKDWEIFFLLLLDFVPAAVAWTSNFFIDIPSLRPQQELSLSCQLHQLNIYWKTFAILRLFRPPPFNLPQSLSRSIN